MNEIRKNNKTYGASSNGGDHEKLANRRGVGIYGETYHLNRDEYKFVQESMGDRPVTPRNVYPSDGEENVYKYVRFEGSEYKHPNHIPMLGVELRIAGTRI
jgi:hypothetical protein